MGKIRKGRLAGVLLLFGATAWGAATLIAGDAGAEPVAPEEAAPEVASEEAPSPTKAAATAWAERTAQVASLLSEFPQVTVHRLKVYPNGTLRLACSVRGNTLRDVALFREALKNHELAGSRFSLSSGSTEIATHRSCTVHGDVGKIMLFNLDLAPTEPVEPDSVEPGTLDLVRRCTATD